MRIGVIGAGAIGGAVAALLDRGGHEVAVTARGENLRAIREHGIRLTGAWGEHAARVDAANALDRTPELVFVATKALDAARALSANRPHLTGIPVVIVQNGLVGLDDARRILPRSDVVGALALYASSLTGPGEIRVGTPGGTYVGGGEDLPARWVVDVLGKVMPTHLEYNFVGAQWTKLVVNQVNALPAITGMSVQEVVANSALRRILTLSIRETVRVGRASGIRFAPLQGLTSRRLGFVLRAPLALADSLPTAMAARMGSVPNPGSTLQSIRRGAPTEVDYLNGAVVDAAAAAGVTAPVNAALVALVHEVERTHEFLEPAEVVRRVGA